MFDLGDVRGMAEGVGRTFCFECPRTCGLPGFDLLCAFLCSSFFTAGYKEAARGHQGEAVGGARLRSSTSRKQFASRPPRDPVASRVVVKS